MLKVKLRVLAPDCLFSFFSFFSEKKEKRLGRVRCIILTEEEEEKVCVKLERGITIQFTRTTILVAAAVEVVKEHIFQEICRTSCSPQEVRSGRVYAN